MLGAEAEAPDAVGGLVTPALIMRKDVLHTVDGRRERDICWPVLEAELLQWGEEMRRLVTCYLLA